MQPNEAVKILIVDDHPENLLALEALLDAPEYRVVRAGSGMEALRYLLKEEFSLILLDVCMPGLNGFETAAMIRERPKTRDIPIVFITAVNKSQSDVEKGYSVGAIDYLIKPFNPEELKIKVAVLTGLQKPNGELRKSPSMKEAGGNPAGAPERSGGDLPSYRSLVNAIPQILWIAQPEGAVEFFNQPWFHYTGLTFEQGEGWGWKKAVHPEDVQPVLAGWVEALRNQREYQVECRLRRSDGAYRWHLLRVTPDRHSQGGILAWLGTLTDIDDQKQAQEQMKDLIGELERKRKEAEAATLLKSEFIRNVSHELRTPLNAIIGYAALSMDGAYGEISDRLKAPVTGIRRNASELLNLINNLLDLSKIESGCIPAVVEPVDLKLLLPGVFENVRSLMHEKKLKSSGKSRRI